MSLLMIPSSEKRPTHVISIYRARQEETRYNSSHVSTLPVPFLTAVPERRKGSSSLLFLTSIGSPVREDSSHRTSEPVIYQSSESYIRGAADQDTVSWENGTSLDGENISDNNIIVVDPLELASSEDICYLDRVLTGVSPTLAQHLTPHVDM